MEYRILDSSLFKDGENRDQLFLHIEITNEGDLWRKAERSCPADVALAVADITAINDIALRMANRAVMTRATEKADDEYNRLRQIEQIKLETTQALLEIEKIKAGILPANEG